MGQASSCIGGSNEPSQPNAGEVCGILEQCIEGTLLTGNAVAFLQSCVPQIGGSAEGAGSPLPCTTLGIGSPAALAFTRLRPPHKLALFSTADLDAMLPAIVCFSLTDDCAVLTSDRAVHEALQSALVASAKPTLLQGSEKPVFMRLADLASGGAGGGGHDDACSHAPAAGHIFLQVVEASGAWSSDSMLDAAVGPSRRQQSGESLSTPASTSSASPLPSSSEPAVRCAVEELRGLLHGEGGRVARAAVARLSTSWERGGGETVVDTPGGQGEMGAIGRGAEGTQLPTPSPGKVRLRASTWAGALHFIMHSRR